MPRRYDDVQTGDRSISFLLLCAIVAVLLAVTGVRTYRWYVWVGESVYTLEHAPAVQLSTDDLGKLKAAAARGDLAAGWIIQNVIEPQKRAQLAAAGAAGAQAAQAAPARKK